MPAISLPILSIYRPRLRRGFTLAELLVVMAIAVVLLTLVTPAFVQVNTGRQVTLAAYNVEGVLNTARAYAKANDTYTWVGFFEEDGSKGSATPAAVGIGRVIISTVASTDGTAINSAALDANNANTPLQLVQINKLVKIDYIHLADGNAPVSLSRPTVPPADQVGYSDFLQTTDPKTTFGYPLGAATPTYKFERIIRFNPNGDAIRVPDDTPVRLMEVGLRPAHGAVPDTATKNCAAIQVTGISGAVRLYQP